MVRPQGQIDTALILSFFECLVRFASSPTQATFFAIGVVLMRHTSDDKAALFLFAAVVPFFVLALALTITITGFKR